MNGNSFLVKCSTTNPVSKKLEADLSKSTKKAISAGFIDNNQAIVSYTEKNIESAIGKLMRIMHIEVEK